MLRTALTLAMCVTLFSGCEKQSGPDPDPNPTHGGHGPQGGMLVELGDHAAHLEVLHDHDAGAVTVHVLDPDLKPLSIAEAPMLNLRTATGPVQVQGTAKGSSGSEWVFSDAGLESEPVLGRFRIVVKGVTYTPDFPQHEH